MSDVLSDKQQAINTASSMAILADRRDWEALEAIFTEEVTADYTALTGVKTVPVKAVDLVVGWQQSFAAFTSTQHMVSNFEVALDGDSAEVRAYFQATHCKPDATLWVLGGTYRFRLLRQDGRWRINAVTMTPLWARNEPNTLGK